MPAKTLYLASKDLEVWEAANASSARNMSALVMSLLRDYLENGERIMLMSGELDKTNDCNRVTFRGKWLIPPENHWRVDDDDSREHFAVARTVDGRWVLYTVEGGITPIGDIQVFATKEELVAALPESLRANSRLQDAEPNAIDLDDWLLQRAI